MESRKKSAYRKKVLFTTAGGIFTACLFYSVVLNMAAQKQDLPPEKTSQFAALVIQITNTPLPALTMPPTQPATNSPQTALPIEAKVSPTPLLEFSSTAAPANTLPPGVTAEPTNTQASGNTAVPTQTPRITRVPSRTPTKTTGAGAIKAGTYRLGVDIQPGVYRGESACTWERLSDLSGEYDAIIASGSSVGQFYVELLSSDYAFSMDCDILPLASLPDPPGDFPNTYQPGAYLVDRDIAPGIYRGEGSCYWERLMDVTGSYESIIANAYPDGQYYIEVKEEDFAFMTDCEIVSLASLPKPTGPLPTILQPGMYLVGRDMRAGTYSGDGPSCYWERLLDVAGDFESIIDNGNPSSSFSVQVRESDFAFYSDCVVERVGN